MPKIQTQKLALPEAATIHNVGVVHCEPTLRRDKDLQSPERQTRALDVQAALERELMATYTTSPDKQVRFCLYPRVRVASEGSRSARIWAAELGRGHAKLEVHWELVDANSNNKDNVVYISETFLQTSDAGCGAADLCQSDAGDRALEIMVQRCAESIVKSIAGSSLS